MKYHRSLSLILATLIAAFSFAGAMPVHAGESGLPYATYNYDFREYIRFTPAAYIPDGIIRGERFTYGGESIGRFVTPQDISRSPFGDLYIADTGNNRIIVLDNTLENCINIIDSFVNEGVVDTFRQPHGVCVSQRGWIYIADSGNNRIVVLDQDGDLVKIVANPRSESLDENFVFIPLKVTVDYADRIYCTAQFMLEGLMVFDDSGEFSSFFGTINVTITTWEMFWVRISTREARQNQRLFIPTEFTGIDIDPGGFVYASNIDNTGEQGVRRLNPRGEDVMKKGENGNVGGDLWTLGLGELAGPSQFTDVVYRVNGIYSALDRRRGRIFTYDHEGNILYIFGGLGTQEGTFNLPVSIEYMNDKLMVLDAARAEIVTFRTTEYGRLINEAVSLRFDGNEAQAVSLWERVIELNEHNELANTGLGKAYLTAGDNEMAAKYLKLGMNREYYSIAFRRYRNEILREHANTGLTVAATLVVAFLVYKRIRKKRKAKDDDDGGFSVE
ncbi:MAG: gluconolactonase [Lachnospiraceae bacterium]|jgi:DNA-binding beta-propeller fold protein YncE|nr:gluconolactonase [Lachnospiraceae bacterium]